MAEFTLPFNEISHNEKMISWCVEQFGSQSGGRWWCFSGGISNDVLSFKQVAKMYFRFDREEDATLFLLRWR